MLADLIALVFPRNCINCHKSLIYEEKFICIRCKLDLPVTNDHLDRQNPLLRKFAFEERIKTASSFLFFKQGGVAQKLIHKLKYKGQKDIGVWLGSLYAQTGAIGQVDMIIPVPIHKTKRAKRGYNQSEFIAKGIGDALKIEVRTDVVERMISTATQTSKSKVDRWTNLENVYSKVKMDLSGKKILVVDDVITTGATVGLLCDRLLEANAFEIHIISMARGK